jgi:glutaconyl-CoA/methylmalonyl-CoA decarboxylase subunit gamma
MSAYTFTINEKTFAVEIGSIQGNMANVTVNQVPYSVRIDGSGQVSAPVPASRPRPVPRPAMPKPAAQAPRPAAPKPQPAAPAPAPPAPTASAGGATITAPIPGKVLSINVKVGDQVSEGQEVVVIEAMKMENTIVSPVDGTVKQIAVEKDSEISTDDLIMIIE